MVDKSIFLCFDDSRSGSLMRLGGTAGSGPLVLPHIIRLSGGNREACQMCVPTTVSQSCFPITFFPSSDLQIAQEEGSIDKDDLLSSPKNSMYLLLRLSLHRAFPTCSITPPWAATMTSGETLRSQQANGPMPTNKP